MIKKLLFFGCISLLTSNGLNAQTPANIPFHDSRIQAGTEVVTNNPTSMIGAKTASNSISDTLVYFRNKFFYRDPSLSSGYPWLLAPMAGTLSFSHWGSVFLNPGTISISGLQCMAARHPSSPSPSVNVRMYLCTTTAGMPNFPPLDSLMGAVSNTSQITTVSASWPTPKVVNGDFVVLFKCIPTVAGDSLKLIRTDARTATSTAVQAKRYGEGLGLIRYNGGFYSTTNLYGTAGSGTDFDFMVAPIVTFSTTTSQASNNLPALCTNTAYTFNNLSSQYLRNRQFNLNEFYKRWSPMANTTAIIDADSVFVWNFGDGSPDRYMAPNATSISVTYTNVGTYTVTLTSNYQKMSNSGVKYEDAAYATKTTSNCSTGTSINEINGFENLLVFPNPSVNGKVTVSGLNGNNTIFVYNMLGQLVNSITSDKDFVTLDLLNQPNGSYIVKIANTATNTVKVVKVVNNN